MDHLVEYGEFNLRKFQQSCEAATAGVGAVDDRVSVGTAAATSSSNAAGAGKVVDEDDN